MVIRENDLSAPGRDFSTQKRLHKQWAADEDGGSERNISRRAMIDSSHDLSRLLQMMFLIHGVLTGMNSSMKNSELCNNFMRTMREPDENKSSLSTNCVPAVLRKHKVNH